MHRIDEWLCLSENSAGMEAIPCTYHAVVCRQTEPATPPLWDAGPKEPRVPLWLSKQLKPLCLNTKLATVDTGCKITHFTRLPSVQSASNNAELEVRKCRKLCDDGLISEAVNALDLLVQRGCHVPNSLFYRVLKRCIQVKDLAFGKCVHALIIKSGYDGDAFLSTHLICLYASHGRLEEAKKVFTKISTPDAYNWASIISAYARHGAAAEAIRLYRQMCELTTVAADNRLYAAVLQGCAVAKDLIAGREVHARIAASPEKPDRFVKAGLVNMYAKCGSLEDARKVFDNLSDGDVVAWNAMIAGYAQHRMGHEAFNLYRRMDRDGLIRPNSVTFICLLQACASIGIAALHEGKQLDSEIRARGLQEDPVVAVTLLHMYVKCGSLVDARRVFDNLLDKNIVAWNAMIAGYAQQKTGQEALCLYRTMQQEGLNPDAVTYVSVLQACAGIGSGALNVGKELHSEIRKQGLQEDLVLGGSLVNMYAKCGSLEDARSSFDKLPEKNIVAWNAMVAGYTQQGMWQEALDLYSSMHLDGVAPNSVTYVCLLQACPSAGEAKHLHAEINKRGLEEDPVVGSSLIKVYAQCGQLDEARIVFDKLANKDVVTWTVMIAGYAQQGMGQEALGLYSDMQQEGLAADCFTYGSLLQACASIGVGALDVGKQLHAEIKEQGLRVDLVLGGSLVHMYASCGSLDNARRLFDELPARDIVAWNAMLAGYVQQGMGQEALGLYGSMQLEGLTPNHITYGCLLQACATVGVEALGEGRLLHAQIQKRCLEQDAVLGVGLVDMYAKCGRIEEARIVFDNLSNRDVVAWTAMIAAYAQQGMGQDALSLYGCMRQEGLTPDSVTYVCLLQACAGLAALPLGEQLHAEFEKKGMRADCNVGAALVNMYAKCGSMYDAQRVFDSLSERSTEAWGALISGYAHQGDSQVVFDLLGSMRLEGVHPDEITALSVLSVCSHVGLVDKGREYFEAMGTEHGISASMEHFICMVGLLGRAGLLGEALQMVRSMPFSPNDEVWHTLLSACWKWKNVVIGEQAFMGAVSVDEKDAASYVLMSNLYASTQMWEEARKLQARRKKLGAWKKPGESWWTDMAGVVHTFLAGDKTHCDREGIYARLGQLIPKMKKVGYVPQLASSLSDLPDAEREAELCAHSEKLAIAYALNKTAEGTTIRIVKNLRVCEDCHTALGYISKLEKRTIICRDSNRFHVFKQGKCSCGDYW